MPGLGLTAARTKTAAISMSHPGHEPSWLNAVLRQFEGPLVLYATRITRDVERARDVVQETFLKLLKEDHRAIEPYLAEWLYTVCRNKALDVHRKERQMTAIADPAVLQPAQEMAPGQRLEQQESTAKALRYLTHLPDNQKEVIRLKFQHGLSYKQISSVTKLSITNVGFLIHTGLKTLREKMGVKPCRIQR